MKIIQVNRRIENGERLHREIQKDETLKDHYISFTTQGDIITFYMEDTLDSPGESYLFFDFVPNFVDENNNSDFEPKIYDYVLPEASNSYFQNIDYNNEVNQYWYRTEIWGENSEKGLLLGVDYFSDAEKTDLILKVRVSYEQDVFGNLVSKQTTRTWVNRNGEDNDNIKSRSNRKIYSPLQSRNATDRRRKNIVQQLEGQLIDLLLEAAGNEPEAQGINLNLGVQFLTAASDSINTFYRSGNPSDIITFVSAAGTIASFPFLLIEVAPGYTAQQFIIDGVTY